MKLNGEEIKELQQALLSAFPSKDALKQMVEFQLEKSLEAIAGGENHSVVVFNLIEWAKAQGKLDELVRGAYTENPTNPALKAFFNKLGYSLKTVQENCSELVMLLNPETPSELDSPFFDATFYSECYKKVEKPGALIRVKAPSKWGKTYLMTQIIYHGNSQGYQALIINFTEPEKEVFTTLERFLKWFCGRITKELNLPDKLAKNWRDILGANSNCTDYFEKYLLLAINSPLILGLDNVDVIFRHQEIACDFFPLLRAWHDNTNTKPIWQKLRLIIAYSKENYTPIDKNKSPFNVGNSIEIPTLNSTQVQKLVQYLHLDWNGEQIEQLKEMVDGHPFLIKEALDKIAQGEITLKELLQIAPTEEGLYGEHLYYHWGRLDENPELQEAMKQVVAANAPVKIDPAKAHKLKDMGLVKYKENSIEPLCDLYRLYFRD